MVCKVFVSVQNKFNKKADKWFIILNIVNQISKKKKEKVFFKHFLVCFNGFFYWTHSFLYLTNILYVFNTSNLTFLNDSYKNLFKNIEPTSN